MESCNIGLIQMLVKSGQPNENLTHAADCIIQARDQGADCILLPECVDLGWGSARTATWDCRDTAEVVAFLCGQAAHHGVYVVSGFTERVGDKVYNAAILIAPDGTVQGIHRKLSLVEGVENCIYSVGDRLDAYDTPFGRIAIPICADNLMPSICIGRTLGLMGVRLILSPSAWAVPPQRYGWAYGDEWCEPYQLLAREYGMTVIGVSNVGVVQNGLWQGYPCIGNSIISAPGEVPICLPYGEDAETIRTYRYCLK